MATTKACPWRRCVTSTNDEFVWLSRPSRTIDDESSDSRRVAGDKLGVYTAAAGAGLSCGARWPLCNGFLGLFPANWPSFIEWFHRLFAMITGFVILGTTYAAWRHTGDRRLRWGSAVALLVLPAQIVLGGLTVTVYTELIQVAHHGAALLIFGALVATTAWAYDDPRTDVTPNEARQVASADD
ncbi:cytochrome AA3 biosynthesis protein [Halobacteriales archaeon QH_6_64_20]|nr:MAG: cytochrome AA3 biosynthesis protein [Halobacteriales archaeon QH_6_64_20]